VLASAGMVVAVVSLEIVVAASGCVVITGVVFGISNSIFGEARSHLTRKCLRRDGHEVTTDGDVLSRSSYHSSASKPDPQWL
jgi:hypothetical protein